jgi:hypothetical protein
MHRSSYTQEIKVDAGDRVVPWPYVLLLLALLAFGAWQGARALQARVDQRHESERITAAAEAPAHPTLARK